jgi:PTH1 family peptidyl-tRNA hydrolase
MKYLIVGLGNVGSEYDATRHNIGFDAADVFVIKHGGSFSLQRHAHKAEVKWKGRTFIVMKPTTYMNLSGKAVKYWMDAEKIPIENTLTIVDDLALPLGALRLRAGGSDAGHNGLKNIAEVLGTQQYPRLRFGIGSDFPKGRQVDFVLGKWKSDELALVKDTLVKVPMVIESWATIGLEKTMGTVNR